MKQKISLIVNGQITEAEVESRTLLVQFLREHLGLTGTHVGCDTSSCGACNVLLDGVTAKACTTLAVQADGLAVTTIEGIADNDALHSIQEAFKNQHGLQCGFCTPGMVITTKGLLDRNPTPSEHEIREALEGNFCRCTGYHNIVKSVQEASGQLS